MYINKPLAHDSKPATDPSDRRAIKRRHLIYYLRVWDIKENKVLGHLVDINTDGLMLISEQKIPLQQTYDLEIRWQDPDMGDRHINFRAESRWSSNDVNPSFHDTGFQFLDVNEDALSPIQGLISRYGFQD